MAGRLTTIPEPYRDFFGSSATDDAEPAGIWLPARPDLAAVQLLLGDTSSHVEQRQEQGVKGQPGLAISRSPLKLVPLSGEEYYPNLWPPLERWWQRKRP